MDTRERRTTGRLKGAFLIALFLLLAVPLHAEEEGSKLVGKEAPAFEAKDPDGNPVTLALLRQDKGPVLINFWGLRCGACIQEIPHLNLLYGKYGKGGLRILGVNVDGLPGPKVKKEMEASSIKIDYPWIPDPEFKVIDLFRMGGAPLNVVIDPAGKVTWHHEGFEEGDEAKIEAEIRKVMPGATAVNQR